MHPVIRKTPHPIFLRPIQKRQGKVILPSRICYLTQQFSLHPHFGFPAKVVVGQFGFFPIGRDGFFEGIIPIELKYLRLFNVGIVRDGHGNRYPGKLPPQIRMTHALVVKIVYNTVPAGIRTAYAGAANPTRR